MKTYILKLLLVITENILDISFQFSLKQYTMALLYNI